MISMSCSRIAEKHHNARHSLSKQMVLQPTLKRVQWPPSVRGCLLRSFDISECVYYIHRQKCQKNAKVY